MEYLLENIDITNLSNYKTPAIARYYFEVHSLQDVDKINDIIIWSKTHNYKILWVSWGTNMLFAFDIFDGIVIKNSLQGWTYNENTKILESYGSESIWNIAQSLEDNYWQDLWHRFIGLPGSIAWAVYGNAGCFGLETENNFLSCDVLNLGTGMRQIFSKDEMNFSYRSSILKEKKYYFLVSAKFDLSKKIEKYHSDVDNVYFRENKQPRWNSCGSFFKNPSKDRSAGFLIEQVGLKWYKIWGAYFSPLHANFLMHDGTGTYKDLLEIITLAEKLVWDKFSVKLENEVQIISNI